MGGKTFFYWLALIVVVTAFLNHLGGRTAEATYGVALGCFFMLMHLEERGRT